MLDIIMETRYVDFNAIMEFGGSLKINPWDFISVEAGYSRFFGDYEGYTARAAGSLQW